MCNVDDEISPESPPLTNRLACLPCQEVRPTWTFRKFSHGSKQFHVASVVPSRRIASRRLRRPRPVLAARVFLKPFEVSNLRHIQGGLYPFSIGQAFCRTVKGTKVILCNHRAGMGMCSCLGRTRREVIRCESENSRRENGWDLKTFERARWFK